MCRRAVEQEVVEVAGHSEVGVGVATAEVPKAREWNVWGERWLEA